MDVLFKMLQILSGATFQVKDFYVPVLGSQIGWQTGGGPNWGVTINNNTGEWIIHALQKTNQWHFYGGVIEGSFRVRKWKDSFCVVWHTDNSSYWIEIDESLPELNWDSQYNWGFQEEHLEGRVHREVTPLSFRGQED